MSTSPVPINPNYTLCVSWQVQGQVVRYLMWSAEGSLLPFNPPQYTNQKIGKNFRFEVWNSSQGDVSQAAAIQFITSVLQAIDYRYAGDTALVVADAPVTTFSCTAIATVAAPPSTNLVGWFRADSVAIGAVHSWTNKVAPNTDILSWDGVHAPVALTSADANNQTVIDFTTGILSGSRANAFQPLFNAAYVDGSLIIVVMKSTALFSTQPVLLVTDSTNATVSSINLAAQLNTVNVNGFGNTTSPINNQNNFMVYLDSAAAGCYSVINQGIAGQLYNNGPTGTTMNTWVLGQAPVQIAEILVYTAFASQGDFNTLLNYLTNRYGAGANFALPLVFPANSISTTN